MIFSTEFYALDNKKWTWDGKMCKLKSIFSSCQ